MNKDGGAKEPDWKEIALTIQANTRASCADECRKQKAPLIEELSEAIALLMKTREYGYEGDLAQQISSFLQRAGLEPK